MDKRTGEKKKEKMIKVLIAEDNTVSARILQKNIENWGYDVLTAKNGEEAWTVFQEKKVRLAILDWMMPKINGIELCRRIRENSHQDENQDYTYIILLTAKDQHKDLIKGFSAGADDYITKPFNHLELKARLTTGKRIIDLQSQLKEQGSRDGLTGLWNRKRMFRVLEKEINRANRTNQPVAAVMVDIDYFKKINDTYGHLMGDSVLQEVASRLKKNIRQYDEIGRYGGDELLMVLQNCNIKKTKVIAERLRLCIAGRKIKTENSLLPITVSVGGTSSKNVKDLSPEALISISDNALFEAKSKGRNCVVINPFSPNRERKNV